MKRATRDVIQIRVEKKVTKTASVTNKKLRIKSKEDAIRFYKSQERYDKVTAKNAFRMLLQSVDESNPEDCARLANSYDFGIGTRKSFKKAFDWYMKAAKGGEKISQYNLYLMYRDGIGIVADLKKAIYWLKKAGLNNDPEALSDLGYMYFHGEGVRKNQSKGIEYYKKAARMKVPRANFNLALVYLNGNSVPPNYKKGMQYLKRAYDLGHQRSAFLLAQIYNGSFAPNIKPSKSLAKKYLNVARKYGIKDKL